MLAQILNKQAPYPRSRPSEPVFGSNLEKPSHTPGIPNLPQRLQKLMFRPTTRTNNSLVTPYIETFASRYIKHYFIRHDTSTMLLYITFTATRAINVGEYKCTHQVEPVCVRRSEKTVYCKPLAAILFDTAVTELIYSICYSY